MENFEAFLPAKFRNLQDGVLITNAAGQILWFNPEFESMCGHKLEEVIGKKPGSFLQGLKSTPEAIQSMRAAINAERPCSVELINYHKDGHEYLVHIAFRPVRDVDGSIGYFAAIERECTQEELDRIGRETLESQLQASLAELVKELQRE